MQLAGFTPPQCSPLRIFSADLFIQWRRGVVLRVIAQHLAFTLARPVLSGLNALQRHLVFYFPEILNAIAGQRYLLTFGRNFSDDVVLLAVN